MLIKHDQNKTITNVDNDDNHQTRAASKQTELNPGIKFDLYKLHDAMQHVTPEIRCGFATINYLEGSTIFTKHFQSRSFKKQRI